MSQNPPINPNIYQPRNFVVSNITRAAEAVVTTDDEYDYVIGQQVRFHIPFPYGMQQLNEKSAYVKDLLTSTSFKTDENTLAYDSFVSSPTYPGNTSPQVSAIGDKNLNSSGITISGAFQQIN